MRIPSREALLSELDQQNHGARLRRVALLGRDAREDPALPPLVHALLSGEAYEATLALEMARSARDGAAVLRALTHPSCQVRGRAAALVGRLPVDAAALERLLPELAPFVRRRILRNLALTRHRALATRLYPLVLAHHGEAEAVLLLPALDPEEVQQRLPSLAHHLRSWRTLVHRFPDTVLGFLRDALARASEAERLVLFSRYVDAFAELSLGHGEAVLALAREFSPDAVLPGFVDSHLPSLLRRHPGPLLALLSRPAFHATLLGQGLTPGALRQLKALSPEQRRDLARQLADAPLPLSQFLAACAPAERPALFAHAFAGMAPRVHPEELLAVLPDALRDAEAARQLGVREVRESRDQQLTTLALRTIEHAREPLRQAATASKAEERARALVLLVVCTGRSRRGLAETLAALARLKNEQDPVRQQVLHALSQLPLSLFEPEHVPALQAQVTSAVEARDASPGTQRALQTLAFRFLRQYAPVPEHPLFRFALETLQRLAAQSGVLQLPSLERELPRGTEHALFAALLPFIRAAHKRESHTLTLTVARALGRRAWNLDMLQALLAPLTEATPDTVAQAAIQLWLAPPRTRDTRVLALLARDESHVTLAPLFLHLHRRRQEKLDPFLRGRALKGRYTTGKTGWVPPVSDGFHRWLPRQQQQLGQVLLRIAGDTERSAWERVRVLRILARLPIVDVDTLTPFLAAQDVTTVEAALGALAALDRPEPALPLLLAHLDGDRARVAMYALPRVARHVSPGVFTHALGALLAREKLKVTVHKEAVRMLGALRVPQALALLRAQWDRPQLHRDVRIAVGHAARQLLDEPAAWELLESLARHPEADLAASLLDESPQRLTPGARPRYAALLLQVSRHPDASVHQRAFMALAPWAPGVEDAVAREAAGRVEDLASGPEWRQALDALVAATREGLAFTHLESCVQRLVGTPPTFDATAERDVPERQRLTLLVRTLLALPLSARVHLRPRLAGLAQTLLGEPSLWHESAALRLAELDWREPLPATQVLLALDEQTHTGPVAEPLFALGLADAVTASVSASDSVWRPEQLLAVADAVRERAPLVAVALVGVAGPRLHWDEASVRLLRALRRHPSPAVRAAALGRVTAAE